MLRSFFIRDRLLMAGLILLGILTAVAGFLSGRSTVRYALSTDARQASISWVARAEKEISLQDSGRIGEIGKRQVRIIAPDLLAQMRKSSFENEALRTTIAPSVQRESGPISLIDRYFTAWISRLTGLLDSKGHVTRIMNFALLDQTGRPILRNTDFSPKALANILSNQIFRADFHKSLGMHNTRIVDDLRTKGHVSTDFKKMILVPVIDGLTINRLYALEVDQSSAATLSKVALIGASILTSLLIVLGYSIPAVIAFRRIRERWQAEDRIRFLALHDPLTGLCNRVQLQHGLEQAVARVNRQGKSLAIMCLDLDRFKDVNDTLGHHAGDTLLKEVARRLLDCVRETDVVARLGGDEFAVVAENIDNPNDAIIIAKRICESIARTYEIEGHLISTSASVGITFAPGEGTEADTLLNNADLALYRAKSEGRNTFRFFETEMDRVVQDRRAMAAELRHALRNDELALHYQPQFDLRSGELKGYEALARWHHSERGNVPPFTFIPIAEEAGLIGILGEWVLRKACRYALSWAEDTTLSVNVSPAQFRSQDITETVRRILEETEFPANRLVLEITENLLLRDTEETIETLNALADLGVSLAIDDFGTGYSSLGYLSRFPVSKLKIDRSFVDKIDSEPEMNAVLSTIIGLGKSLNVTTSAEGVETNTQSDYLLKLGCDEAQGYLFGRPRPEVLPGSLNSSLESQAEDMLPAGDAANKLISTKLAAQLVGSADRESPHAQYAKRAVGLMRRAAAYHTHEPLMPPAQGPELAPANQSDITSQLVAEDPENCAEAEKGTEKSAMTTGPAAMQTGKRKDDFQEDASQMLKVIEM